MAIVVNDLVSTLTLLHYHIMICNFQPFTVYSLKLFIFDKNELYA
jgi:hypothetical protein